MFKPCCGICRLEQIVLEFSWCVQAKTIECHKLYLFAFYCISLNTILSSTNMFYYCAICKMLCTYIHTYTFIKLSLSDLDLHKIIF